ncbi:MAG: hypothetical protein ACO1SV_16960 [Fimbriimonas sp.]
MRKKTRLPVLALAFVGLAHAVPQTDIPPARLANDFVFRALQKEKAENAAIAPGGPLAGLAAIGAAGHTLPELAGRRVGGSPEAADKLLEALGKAEQKFGRSVTLRHTRSAWLTTDAAVPAEVLTVRPMAEALQGAPRFLDRATAGWRFSVLDRKPPAQKPTGLATVSAFEAPGLDTMTPQPEGAQILFDRKPVETLYAIAEGYSEDEIAQTVTLRLGRDTPHLLILAIPRESTKLDDFMTEVGARVETAVGAEKQVAFARFPRIVQTTEADVAEALGLGKEEISAQTRTGVVIGGTYKEIAGGSGAGRGGGGGIGLKAWRPPVPMISLSPGSGSRGKVNEPKPPPTFTFDRPFVYAVVEPKSRTIVLAGIVRKVEPAKPSK